MGKKKSWKKFCFFFFFPFLRKTAKNKFPLFFYYEIFFFFLGGKNFFSKNNKFPKFRSPLGEKKLGKKVFFWKCSLLEKILFFFDWAQKIKKCFFTCWGAKKPPYPRGLKLGVLTPQKKKPLGQFSPPLFFIFFFFFKKKPPFPPFFFGKKKK